jgi:hypothetical protein
MWTDAAVAKTTVIAVETEHLESCREAVFHQPPIGLVPCRTTVILTVRRHSSAVLGPIVADVVDREKQRFRFSAARAFVTAVGSKHAVLQSNVPGCELRPFAILGFLVVRRLAFQLTSLAT